MPGPFSGLSVKLIATITLVILAVEVVIYLPSAGNFRQSWLNDRFEGEQDAPLVQRGDDLVGGAHVFLAHRLAFDVGPIGDKRAAPLRLGGIERFLRVRQNLIDGPGMARRSLILSGI